MVYETTRHSEHPADAEEVCNYVDAMAYARKELARPKGLPLCMRLLCALHKRLMKGFRGSEKQPGTIRKSQNWIAGKYRISSWNPMSPVRSYSRQGRTRRC